MRYNIKYNEMVKEIGGKWNAVEKKWYIANELFAEKFSAINELFAETETVTLRIVAKRDITKPAQTGIFFAGYKIASAFGRDSGARFGDGVTEIGSQNAYSCGSVKNPMVHINENGEFHVHKFPKKLYEMLDLESDIWTAELVDSVDKKIDKIKI